MHTCTDKQQQFMNIYESTHVKIIHTYIRVHICIHTQTCVHLHIIIGWIALRYACLHGQAAAVHGDYIYAYIYICTHIFTQINMCTPTRYHRMDRVTLCMSARTSSSSSWRLHAYIHTCAYIYTHTNMCTPSHDHRMDCVTLCMPAWTSSGSEGSSEIWRTPFARKFSRRDT